MIDFQSREFVLINWIRVWCHSASLPRYLKFSTVKICDSSMLCNLGTYIWWVRKLDCPCQPEWLTPEILDGALSRKCGDPTKYRVHALPSHVLVHFPKISRPDQRRSATLSQTIENDLTLESGHGHLEKLEEARTQCLARPPSSLRNSRHSRLACAKTQLEEIRRNTHPHLKNCSQPENSSTVPTPAATSRSNLEPSLNQLKAPKSPPH